jgi:hypothetical protein
MLYLLPYFQIQNNVSLDTMHAIFIGITKTLTNSLEKPNSPFFEKSKIRKIIKKYVINTKLPINYNKELYDFINCKAINNLLIILYCFKIFKICSVEFYKIFKLLNCIVTILYSELIKNEDLILLEIKVNEFMILFQEHFGLVEMNHNVHLLNHISRSIRLFGPSSISSNNMFKYEGFNKNINEMVKTNQNFEKRILDNFYNKIEFEQNTENDEDLSNLVDDLNKKNYRSHPGFNLKIDNRNLHLKKKNYLKTKNNSIIKIVDFDLKKEIILGKIIGSKDNINYNFKDIDCQIIKSYSLKKKKKKKKISFSIKKEDFKEININHLL